MWEMVLDVFPIHKHLSRPTALPLKSKSRTQKENMGELAPPEVRQIKPANPNGGD
jgi:hypothetical protein